tara:strand:- start:24422 stop:25036 length:615 start_codon:yes stop_codon:yes gene_type:complete
MNVLENIELFINEEDELDGVHALSVVGLPAIEMGFIALSAQQEIKLAEVSNEKRILMGPALIPDKRIYRRIEDYEYTISLNADTVLKASQLFLKAKNQSNSTLEHSEIIEGLTVVESWIVDNPEMDKAKEYGFNVPKGTWMTSVKVYNDEIWNDYVKTGKVKGFSIEGFFSEKLDMKKIESLLKQDEENQLLNKIKQIIEEDGR